MSLQTMCQEHNANKRKSPEGLISIGSWLNYVEMRFSFILGFLVGNKLADKDH
jgi:hypothetical protein